MISYTFPKKVFSSTHHVGFTLIELLITIAILAILAAIVIPSYNRIIMVNNRGDAISALPQIAQDLEQCRSATDTLAFNDETCMADYADPITPGRGLYQITVNATAKTYTITATPVAGKKQADDSECSQFTYNHVGVKSAHSNDATPKDTTKSCWKE